MTTKRKREVSKGPLDGVNEDGIEQFRKVLQELKSNAQSKIKQLTAIAESQKEQSDRIADMLNQEVLNAQAHRIQPLIYVVDSIIKKLGKEYRMHLISFLPGILGSAVFKADQALRSFLQKIVSESWKKHDLLPQEIALRLDAILAGAPPANQGQVKTEPSPQVVASSFSNISVKSEDLVAPGRVAPPAKPPPAQPSGPPAQTGQVPISVGARPPPMKGPPPKPPMKMELSAEPAATRGSSSSEVLDRSPLEEGLSDDKVLERRLDILTKIIDRTGPSQDELREFMRLPELVEAMAMQRQGKKTEAMALLAAFKAELEKKVERNKLAGEAKPVDPRQLDTRQAEKPTDPRALDPRQSVDPRRPTDPAKPQDPRQKLFESKQAEASKRPADAQIADPRQKQAKLASQTSMQAVMAAAAGPICIDDDEDEKEPEVEEVAPGTDAPGLAKARQILQGLPSLGFSEGWLRQFMEQMPVRGGPSQSDAAAARKQAPCIGRKVLSAEGEQMVYVDELAPNEVLLLLQLIFLLEERLQKGGGPGGGAGADLDLTQRIPHTFSYLQVEPAIDVMLKRFFDDLPYQCPTTGLRFGSREKLRRHNDGLFRRRALQQQRQRGAEARGWMETIPEWVGNRDLNVGPALFQLGGGAASEEASAQRAQRAAELHDNADYDGEEEQDSERSHWISPLDERRAVCPISGEPFERQWSYSLNDWAFSDVVAVELGSSDKVLRFPPRNAGDPERLAESALLFKKACYLSTATAKRLSALEECCTVHAMGGEEGDAPKKLEKAVSEDVRAELEQLEAVLADAAKTPKRKFF